MLVGCIMKMAHVRGQSQLPFPRSEVRNYINVCPGSVFVGDIVGQLSISTHFFWKEIWNLFKDYSPFS